MLALPLHEPCILTCRHIARILGPSRSTAHSQCVKRHSNLIAHCAHPRARGTMCDNPDQIKRAQVARRPLENGPHAAFGHFAHSGMLVTTCDDRKHMVEFTNAGPGLTTGAGSTTMRLVEGMSNVPIGPGVVSARTCYQGGGCEDWTVQQHGFQPTNQMTVQELRNAVKAHQGPSYHMIQNNCHKATGFMQDALGRRSFRTPNPQPGPRPGN